MNPEVEYFQPKSGSLQEHLKRFDQRSTWTELNPQLSLSDQPFQAGLRFEFESADAERAVAQASLEGYLQSRSPVIPERLCQALSQAVETLLAHRFHPIYVALYDEYWQVMQGIQAYLEPVLGPGCHPVGDFWSWCISPTTAPAGWAPHRDYQFKTKTLREDGRPMLVTCWLPFRDATPLNGCMYLVPQNLDPNLPDHPEKYGLTLQNVRALPARAGTVLAWNQFVFHWGSRCSSFAEGPRISTGIYYQSADVDPYVDKVVDFQKPLPFESRLAFIASNILNYHQYHDYPQEILDMCIRHIRHLPQYEKLVPSSLFELLPDG